MNRIALLALSAAFTAAAAEQIELPELRKWNRTQEWKISEGTATADNLEKRWSNLMLKKQFPEGVYRLSYSTALHGKSLKDQLFVQFGTFKQNVTFSQTAGNAAGTVSSYFYAPASDVEQIMRFQLFGTSGFRAQISNIRLEKLSEDDLRKITVDFNSETGNTPLFFHTYSWKDGDVAVVDAEDHIDGGKAMRVTAGAVQKKYSVISSYLPVSFGKKYRLTFSAKSPDSAALTFGPNTYVPGQRNWKKLEKFALTPEWKEYTVEFASPDLNLYPHMKSRTFFLDLSLAPGKEAFFKSFTLEVL